MTEEICPCGSGKAYGLCCEPIIKKTALAESPEALMRSRYSAYAKGEILWLRDSLEEKQRKGFDEKGARQWSNAEWLGLRIIESKIDEAKNAGWVEFAAKFKQGGVAREHHEVSEFVRKNNEWVLTEGQMVKPETVRNTEQAIGRNDPCPCGSGKKYKKCCGG